MVPANSPYFKKMCFCFLIRKVVNQTSSAGKIDNDQTGILINWSWTHSSRLHSWCVWALRLFLLFLQTKATMYQWEFNIEKEKNIQVIARIKTQVVHLWTRSGAELQGPHRTHRTKTGWGCGLQVRWCVEVPGRPPPVCSRKVHIRVRWGDWDQFPALKPRKGRWGSCDWWLPVAHSPGKEGRQTVFHQQDVG